MLKQVSLTGEFAENIHRQGSEMGGLLGART